MLALHTARPICGPRQRARRRQSGEAAADDDDVRQVAARVPAAVQGASRSRGWRNDAGSRVAKQPMVAAGGRGAVPAARDARHTGRLRQALRNQRLEPAMPDNEKRIALLRSEEHTSELQSLMRISYAVFFLKKQTK